jgi:hypothetical protein
VIAVQRFYLGSSTGVANAGKFHFSPTSRAYSGLGTHQTNQDYDAFVFGDVAAPFIQ